MNSGKTVFAQIMDFLPDYYFEKCVDRYNGNYKVKSFSCRDQFLCMAFAQLAYRESLRDIEACLKAVQPKLYHAGFKSVVSRNNLANANKVRNWRIYEDLAQIMIKETRKLYANDESFLNLENTIYALDSTTIDLCLSLFPWAKFRKRKGAIKVHTLLDLQNNIPTIAIITDGKVHDVKILDQISFEPGAFYIMDRAYVAFDRLYLIDKSRSFFVTRAKSNFKYKRLYSNPVDKSTGLLCDQVIVLTGYHSKKAYPDKLRRVKFIDLEKNKRYVFLTNNFTLPAQTIADLYKSRWQIELFFKWIKQHLRIKAFLGTSENAVKTQIWIAIAIYVLIAHIKKQLKIELTLYTILQILSISLFEKVPLRQLLTIDKYKNQENDDNKQLYLFD